MVDLIRYINGPSLLYVSNGVEGRAVVARKWGWQRQLRCVKGQEVPQREILVSSRTVFQQNREARSIVDISRCDSRRLLVQMNSVDSVRRDNSYLLILGRWFFLLIPRLSEP